VRKTERYRLEVEISAHVHDRRGKKRGRPPLYGGPTPEMLAKAQAAHGVDQVLVGPGHDPAHRIKSAVDVSREHLTDAERYTAYQVIRDLELAGTVNVTANYDGVPVQAHGARHGGVPDPCREAHNLVTLIKARIDPQFWAIVEFLADEVRLRFAGKPSSVADLGRKLTAYTGDDQARAAGVAAIKMTLIRVEEELRRERALDKQSESTSELRSRVLLRSERESLVDARKRVFSRETGRVEG